MTKIERVFRYLVSPVSTSEPTLVDQEDIESAFSLIKKRLQRRGYAIPDLEYGQRLSRTARVAPFFTESLAVAEQPVIAQLTHYLFEELEEVVTYYLAHLVVSNKPFSLDMFDTLYLNGRDFVRFLAVKMDTTEENLLDYLAEEYLRPVASHNSSTTTMLQKHRELVPNSAQGYFFPLETLAHHAADFLVSRHEVQSALLENVQREAGSSYWGFFKPSTMEISVFRVLLASPAFLRVRSALLGVQIGVLVGSGVQTAHESFWGYAALPSCLLIPILSTLAINDISSFLKFQNYRHKRKHTMVHEILHRISISHFTDEDCDRWSKMAFVLYKDEE